MPIKIGQSSAKSSKASIKGSLKSWFPKTYCTSQRRLSEARFINHRQASRIVSFGDAKVDHLKSKISPHPTLEHPSLWPLAGLPIRSDLPRIGERR